MEWILLKLIGTAVFVDWERSNKTKVFGPEAGCWANCNATFTRSFSMGDRRERNSSRWKPYVVSYPIETEKYPFVVELTRGNWN